MSALVTLVYILAGALAGRTINLGGYQFVDGKLTVEDTAEQHALRSRFLAMNWQAFPEGDPRIAEINKAFEEANANVQREVPPAVAGPNGAAPVSGNSEPGEPAAGAGTDLGEGAAGAEAGSAERPATGEVGHEAGVKEPVAPTNEKLARAVRSLDPNDDANWTKDGLPAMQAVETAYGSADITRADIKAAVPGWTRDTAKAAAAGGPAA